MSSNQIMRSDMLIAETPRLYLREFQLTDAADMFELNNDPEVLKYTGNKPFSSIQEAEEFLRQYDHYKKFGYGRWAMVHKETHGFLGWCGLKFTPEVNETDVGFRLKRNYWNQGFATEAATACLELGFSHYNLYSIVGRAMKANSASIKVLEKLGMQYWKDFEFDAKPGAIYKIERQ